MGKGYKGRNPRGAPRPKDPDAGSAEEEEPKFVGGNRGLSGQAATVGMLPPSDSDEESGPEGAGAGEASGSQPEKPKPEKKPAGQSKTAGMMPPSDSEDDSDDSSSSGDNGPEYLRAAPRKNRNAPEPRDPEDIRKEMERLALIRKKREEDRQKRIATEGWDRFAPVTETNKPPGTVAPDLPAASKGGH